MKLEVVLMTVKMSAVTLLYVAVTYFLWEKMKDREFDVRERTIIGLIFGAMSIMSTHFGIDFGPMLLNVRDLGPMCAGIFFDPIAGIIAGLIGGIERYIAGAYWGIGSFTKEACSLSTMLAGFLAAFLNTIVFRSRIPPALYAMSMGAVIEVFHMYVVFITHKDDLDAAFVVVRACALPMIFFSAMGLFLAAEVLSVSSGEWVNPLKRREKRDIPLFNTFQTWLFIVVMIVFILNYGFNYRMQTLIAYERGKDDITSASGDIREAYRILKDKGGNVTGLKRHVGDSGFYYIYRKTGEMTGSKDWDDKFEDEVRTVLGTERENVFFTADIDGGKYLSRIDEYRDGTRVIIMIPESAVYEYRNIQGYETLFADILLFAVVYVLISLLVQTIVTDKLALINGSLDRITHGELNEKVDVYSSMEFASLSDDINETVDVLKGYIAAAEKRIEQELMLARTIQDSALPKNFDFDHTGFEIYATMDPAKEVGGDFYDFFFVDKDKIALVIADVSGKGIPASLFMMRSKTAIRSLAETGTPLAEVLEKVNNNVCVGNEASMFVTVWMCIADLTTGDVRCVNAGHEYPVLKHGERYELIKGRHRPPLGVMEGMKFTAYDMHLDPGDCLYVYTDGVPEAINTDQEQYGTDRLLKVLNLNADKPVTELLPAVKRDMDRFVGEAEQFDDITMMGFRYFGNGDRKKADDISQIPGHHNMIS